MVITLWYTVIGFIVYAELIESYSMYVMTKDGQLVPVNEVLHLDVKDTAASMRERLRKELTDFLREPRNHGESMNSNQKRSKNDYIDFRHLMQSPVVYTNGRYTLDLEKIDVQDVNDVAKISDEEQEYYDPADSFRDYYDYIGISDRLRSVTDNKIPWEHLKKLSKYLRREENFRKDNNLMLDDKTEVQDLNADFFPQIYVTDKRLSKKRFNVINNNSLARKKRLKPFNNYEGRSREKRKPKKFDFDPCDEFPNLPECIQSDLSQETKENSGTDGSVEYDDGVYLQGNALVNFNGKDKDLSDENRLMNEDSDDEYRRRLSHFMPKRYHWNPKDIKKLGYYWFNGPKGKYPSPTSVS